MHLVVVIIDISVFVPAFYNNHHNIEDQKITNWFLHIILTWEFLSWRYFIPNTKQDGFVYLFGGKNKLNFKTVLTNI